MGFKGPKHLQLSIAERTAIGCFLVAGLLAFWDWRLSVIPVIGFVLICIAAPFFSRIGFFLPVISRGKSGRNAVTLTFDDGPDPLSTPALLELLEKHRVKATFFVSGKRASRYSNLIDAIRKRGHAIGNHSFTHDPFLPFKSTRTIDREIRSTQAVLNDLGVQPLVFRPPAGILGPRLNRPLQRAGLTAVNFSCRATDFGNRRISGIARKILGRVRPDDIILLHDAMPKGGAYLDAWLDEIELLATGVRKKGLAVIPLSEMIGQPATKIRIDGSEEFR